MAEPAAAVDGRDRRQVDDRFDLRREIEHARVAHPAIGRLDHADAVRVDAAQIGPQHHARG